MEKTAYVPETYDFRQYDRIWQRVAPTLEPYPGHGEGTGEMGQTAVANAGQMEAVARQESQLPGAEMNPCCMGSAAAESLEVLIGFIEAELTDSRRYMTLTRQAPVWARQRLREISAEESCHARRLMAVYYLITGECYRPRIVCEQTCAERWCVALRERYHSAACNGLNYARAADETTDLCLSNVLKELSGDEYRHAEQILCMLERGMTRQ